jgi:hypothetical protein
MDDALMKQLEDTTELDCAEQLLGALRELEAARGKADYGNTLDQIQEAIYVTKRALHTAIN